MSGSERLDYWRRKVATRAEASFGPGAIVAYADRILAHLHRQPTGAVEAPDLQGLARQFGVPLKFLVRALAPTLGIVRVEMAAIRVVLQWERLPTGARDPWEPEEPMAPTPFPFGSPTAVVAMARRPPPFIAG